MHKDKTNFQKYISVWKEGTHQDQGKNWNGCFNNNQQAKRNVHLPAMFMARESNEIFISLLDCLALPRSLCRDLDSKEAR